MIKRLLISLPVLLMVLGVFLFVYPESANGASASGVRTVYGDDGIVFKVCRLPKGGKTRRLRIRVINHNINRVDEAAVQLMNNRNQVTSQTFWASGFGHPWGSTVVHKDSKNSSSNPKVRLSSYGGDDPGQSSNIYIMYKNFPYCP